MTKVLLTGVGGNLGSHAFKWLLENTDWYIIATDSFKRQHTGRRKWIKKTYLNF